MRKLFFAAGVLLSVTGPAHATIFCEVLKTSDGFLALRAGPSVKAKLVFKIKSGEQVQVGLGRSGAWDKVIYYLKQKKSADPKPLTGWVNPKFLSDECG
jgi:uncharacterized protein YgiM (DUF1202 family)